LVDDKKKEEKKINSVSGQQINRPKGDYTDAKLKLLKKACLEQNQKALDTSMQIEKDKLELEKSKLKMQEALLAEYLVQESNQKKHEDEEKKGGQGQEPNESDARYWIRKYQSVGMEAQRRIEPTRCMVG
jgi:hypothetical protein